MTWPQTMGIIATHSVKGRSVRYIYVDEAGTAAREPVTVVVGVIVKPDAHWKEISAELSRLRMLVPERYREDFVFHAKTVWGNPRLRDGWSMQERLELIAAYAAITKKFGLSIALGKVRRDAGGQELLDKAGATGQLSLANWHHIQAFAECMLKADAYLRERCDEYEIGTLIVEDIPEMRDKLRAIFSVAQHLYIPDHVIGSEMNGRRQQGISRIPDGVHFAGKDQSAFLQIADACAFSFRRFFAGQEHGQYLVEAMGLDLSDPAWFGPMSAALFSPDPILRLSPYPIDPV